MAGWAKDKAEDVVEAVKDKIGSGPSVGACRLPLRRRGAKPHTPAPPAALLPRRLTGGLHAWPALPCRVGRAQGGGS